MAVAAKLGWVRNHREEAAALGREAAQWVHQNRNVWDKSEGLITAMEHHLGSHRRLRQTVAI
ncbi:hypothetical protein AB0N07_44935 [Streptomyces sp. NPDC051172]|uniref:hypothetical protein n=1 Tax=Streptomyces sp. NPDC051172 TaxID=3155796 RepID=UPI0034236A45